MKSTVYLVWASYSQYGGNERRHRKNGQEKAGRPGHWLPRALYIVGADFRRQRTWPQSTISLCLCMHCLMISYGFSGIEIFGSSWLINRLREVIKALATLIVFMSWKSGLWKLGSTGRLSCMRKNHVIVWIQLENLISSPAEMRKVAWLWCLPVLHRPHHAKEEEVQAPLRKVEQFHRNVTLCIGVMLCHLWSRWKQEL